MEWFSKGPQAGRGWSSCPARRGWGLGLAQPRERWLRGGWQPPPQWGGGQVPEMFSLKYYRDFCGLWTTVTPKEFIRSHHFPDSFVSENNEGIFIWKKLLKEETWRKGINSSLEYKGAAVYIWLSCHSQQFLRTTVWLHDYKRYQVTAGLIDCARNCSTDMICNLSRPYFCRKRVPLFASSTSRANHVCCSHSETCSPCNARCSQGTRLRTGLSPW